MKTQVEKPVLCTSTKQALRLIKAGVDPETSDMTWCDSPYTSHFAYGEEHRCLFAHPGVTTSHDLKGTPCWSINALINLLPPTMPDSLDAKHELRLTIQPTMSAWSAFYADDGIIGKTAVANELNEALVSLIEKVIK